MAMVQRKLRIAYLTEWSPYSETGVTRKLIGQVETWRDLGHEAEILSLTPTRPEEPSLSFTRVGSVVGVLPQSALDKYRFARLGYVNKILSVPLLKNELARIRPDVIYYRQNGPWYPGLGSVLRTVPSIMEINTDEYVERHMWGPADGALFEATQSRVLSSISGFVSVTTELTAHYKSLGKPMAVVPNGFWGEPPVNVPPTNNKQPEFIFVGSMITASESWHGVDKIFSLARLLTQCRFNVVGLNADDFPGVSIPPNVIMHGFLTGPALTQVFLQSDVGIGTLALHRKGMDEACPLKVRDYLMHRLPVIIGYTEAEEILNTSPYVLRLPNQEDNASANADRILAFGFQWLGRRVTADLSFMSRKGIEERRLAFLTAVCSLEPLEI